MGMGMDRDAGLEEAYRCVKVGKQFPKQADNQQSLRR
jgi:hypothetical protein